MDRKTHWDTQYTDKTAEQVSWTQKVPATSLELIRPLNLPKTARIIDIGGGDSRLADELLREGYTDISVLDISDKALERAQKRLGADAGKITWIVSDINRFEPEGTYDLWHDRAAFHFLTEPGAIARYRETVRNHVSGYLVFGTFSENGPAKCSGLDVKRYGADSLEETFRDGFQKIRCHTEDHHTPFGTVQNFLFCSFRRSPDPA